MEIVTEYRLGDGNGEYCVVTLKDGEVCFNSETFITIDEFIAFAELLKKGDIEA